MINHKRFIFVINIFFLIFTLTSCGNKYETIKSEEDIQKTNKPSIVKKNSSEEDKCGNSVNDYEPILRRIAPNLNDNWGKEAINVLDVDLSNSAQKSIKVAVIDTGVNSSNSVLEGYNSIDKTNNTIDTSNHGSIVSSIITSVSPRIKILPIKITDQSEKISSSKIITDGIEWALNHNADIINISLGLPDNNVVENSINKAIYKGVPVIASAGNTGENNLSFPAAMDKVISVIARDINNVDVGFSNRSSCKKSFSAPGVNLKINEHEFSGTSYSAAFVSATVALMKLEKPDLDVDTIISILEKTSVDGNNYSYGLIQADKALLQIRKD